MLRKRERDINKAEMKQLKQNLKLTRKDYLESKERANELERNLETTKSSINKLQEELKVESEKQNCKEKETSILSK